MALHRSQENLRSTHTGLRVDAVVSGSAPGYLYSVQKRALDVAIALFGVTILALTLPFIALAIKLNSSGPVFYRQRRMGLHGEVFELIKFRTMTTNAEADGNAVWSEPGDPRITGIGRVLRRLYLDEMPQWWNVLRGEMSVVGPRPERPELAAKILNFVPGFNYRLMAKPGITGLAQINYKYTNTTTEARNKLRHDVVYIGAASLWLDLKLTLRTFRRISTFKGT